MINICKLFEDYERWYSTNTHKWSTTIFVQIVHTPSLLTKYAYLGVSNLLHYAQTLIPLADYNHIDWHCKIYVQARRCVDLNFVTTLHISDSSLFMKNNWTFNCEKNLLSTSIMKPAISFLVSLLIKSAWLILITFLFSVVAHWIFENFKFTQILYL